MKFGAFLRLGRITALIVFAIILTGLGLCGSAAQPLPLTVLTASAPAMRTPQPISSLAPAALPTQRITKEAAAEWMQRSERSGEGSEPAAPTPTLRNGSEAAAPTRMSARPVVRPTPARASRRTSGRRPTG